jgi:hypothetical protein
MPQPATVRRPIWEHVPRSTPPTAARRRIKPYSGAIRSAGARPSARAIATSVS